ncbi:MAG: hypothetical protein J6A21_01560 [Lentisphaeria bacterium]|nr:hypothetical protein [Lentisphaeria bacterium]
MLEITSHRNGEILNYKHGRESAESLIVRIRGIASPQSSVTVNGIPAERNDREFSVDLPLTEKINTVTAKARDKFGERTQSITLVWDKGSFKRYAVRIDDNSFFFTDLARERPKHLMDHFYLKKLKEFHGKYGSKFILKCFFRNDHDREKFTLDKVPDCYRSEFEDNSDWLHLAFHALGEFPDRPYQHCTEKQLARDYDCTMKELIRIAGKKSCSPPTNVHWAMLAPENFHVLQERGLKILTSSGFMANRIIVEGEVQQLQNTSCDIGFFYEQDVAHHMLNKRCFFDPDYGLFLSRTFFCFNIDTPSQIEEKIRQEDGRSKEKGCEMMECVGHEQYAYPSYFNYLPDYFERLETSCRVPAELGYKPVFFQEGIFGNTAWEK